MRTRSRSCGCLDSAIQWSRSGSKEELQIRQVPPTTQRTMEGTTCMQVCSLRSSIHAAWLEERNAKHAWENWSLAAIAPARASDTCQPFEPHLNPARPHVQRSREPRSRQQTAVRSFVCMLCVLCCVGNTRESFGHTRGAGDKILSCCEGPNIRSLVCPSTFPNMDRQMSKSLARTVLRGRLGVPDVQVSRHRSCATCNFLQLCHHAHEDDAGTTPPPCIDT